MQKRADQQVLDYLAKVSAEAQRYLPPKRRTDYVTEVRSRIETERAKAKATSADAVSRLLDELGDPADLVARECGADRKPGSPDDDDDEERPDKTTSPRRQLGILTRPVRLRRAPPPWEGGPRRTRMYRRSDKVAKLPSAGLAPHEGRTRGVHPAVVFVRLMYAARKYPLDVAAIIAYLMTGLIYAITFLWVVAAVQVMLSKVWPARDKRIAVGVPIAAMVIGIALWDNEAGLYPDQYLMAALPETGALGLRIGAVAMFFYLAVRMSRLVRANNPPRWKPGKGVSSDDKSDGNPE